MDRFHAAIRAAIRRAARLPRRAIRAGKAALHTAYAAMRRCAHVSGWRRALPLLLCAVLLAELSPHAKIPSGQTPGGGEPVFGPIHFVGSAAGSNPQRPYARRRRTAQTDTAVSSPSREMPAMPPVNTDAQPPASAVAVVAGDAAAAHVERAAVHIHAAAAVFRLVGLVSRRVADGAAAHVERTVGVHIHTAAVGVVGRVVAGDAAAAHGKHAAAHIHAAAVARRRLVAADARAAAHVELAAAHV